MQDPRGGEERRPDDAITTDALYGALTEVTQAVAITDAGGAVLFWNAAAEDLFGYASEQASGADLRDLIVPPEWRADTDELIAALEPGCPYLGELVVRHRSGRVFEIWASLSYVAASSDEGPGHFVAVCVDLTEQRGAARQNQMLASIVASSQDSIISVDRAGRVVWANPATERVLGWKPQDLVGQPVEVLVPPAYREHSEATRLDLLNGAELPIAVEAQAVRRDGSLLDVSLMVNAYRDARGHLVGTSVAIHDISEEVRTRRQLESMVARHTAQFEQVSVPQAFLDLDGTFLAVNDALCRLVGCPREELVGTSYETVLHPLDDHMVTDERVGFRQEQTSATSYEVLARRPDGRVLPVLIDAAVLHDADDKPYGIAVFARDLSEVREAERRLSAQQNLFRALNRRSSDAAVVTDVDLNLVYVSPSVMQVLGYEPQDVVAQFSLDYVHPEDREAVLRATRQVLAEPDATNRLVLRLRDADGEWRWIEQTTTNCLADPDIGGLVMNIRDVSAEVQAQQALRHSEARYRAIAETAQEGIMVISPEGEVSFANETLAEIVGYSTEEICELGLYAALPPDQAKALAERIATRPDRGPERYELPYRHPDGGDMVLSVSAAPLQADDRYIGSLAMITDVTEARRAEAELRRQALHDSLTGLPNRALLVDRLDMAAARQERSETGAVAVLFLDLDNFKMVNDSRGHEIGDQLLRAVAVRLQDAVRHADTVARLGGDEFAVVCEETDAEAAETVAARIQAALSAPFDLAGQTVYASASIGIALSPPHRPTELLRHADAAMYRAKASGRRGVAVFDTALASDSQRTLEVFTRLREVLHEPSIALGYQPVVDLVSREVLGVEALLRWVHPELGPVSPAEAIAAAEQSGLSLDLDELVLASACEDMARFRAEGVLGEAAYVAVNLSAKTAEAKRLDGVVDDVLARTGLSASALVLEVTENAVMNNPEQAVELLERLTRRGLAIAVDDFGTGYSSLAYLQRLPVQVLKVDRSFVARVTEDAGSRTIARSVVGLANALGLRVVAEGIETPDQAETMRQLGCHAGQGYLWGPAVPPSDLAAAVAATRLSGS